MIFEETVDIFDFRDPTQFTSNCTLHTLQQPSIPGLCTGMLQPHKYLRWLLTSWKPLLYICSFSAVNLVRGRRFIWCKGRGCILWFPKTVSPSPRGVGRRRFYSITVFFCDGCKSVIKRSWKQSNIAKGLLAGTDFRQVKSKKMITYMVNWRIYWQSILGSPNTWIYPTKICTQHFVRFSQQLTMATDQVSVNGKSPSV